MFKPLLPSDQDPASAAVPDGGNNGLHNDARSVGCQAESDPAGQGQVAGRSGQVGAGRGQVAGRSGQVGPVTTGKPLVLGAVAAIRRAEGNHFLTRQRF